MSDWSYNKKLAVLLCYNDRYGSGKAMKNMDNSIKNILNIIKKLNKDLRKKLSERGDNERIQAQRPLVGESMLSITAPESSKYSKQLNALLVLAQHPEKGIETYRLDDMDKVPFLLHQKLQPDQPSIENKKIKCKKINNLLKSIFDCINDKKVNKEVCDFVEKNIDSINKLGFKKGSKFESQLMEYSTFIAPVIPGKQIILWKTWHSTGGASDNKAKITTFIDLCPCEYLSPELNKWYKFICENAPYDPGAGSARGSWNSFVGLSRSNAKDFGIPEAKDNNKWFQERKGLEGVLNDYDLEKFEYDGYLVIDIPDYLQEEYSADATINDFENWFSLISDNPGFTFEKNIKDLVKTGKKDDFKYYTDKIDINDPFNPEEHDKSCRKSHNPQMGGKMIANDSGMGPGSTYVNSREALGFVFSQWITNIFSSFPFYQNKKLIRVLERFRVKMNAKWSKNAHVDINGLSFIKDI